jgi:glycosyltransferase involved in cell wall biosynthesis
MLKLVIAQSNLTLKGGAERVVLKIAQHYNASIYTIEYDKDRTFGEFKDLDINVIGKGVLSKILPYGRVSQGLNYGVSFYNLKLKEDYDVINAHMVPSHWIRNRNERVLWYVHTPFRDVYDLYEFRMRLKKFYQKPVHWAGIRAVRSIDQKVVKRIEGILSNSSNTRSRIVKYYGRRDASVLNGGIEYEKYSDNGTEKYFVYAARFSPNKRQEYAIDAFRLFEKKVKGYRLLLVGPVSKDKAYYDYYLRIAAEAKKSSSIRILKDMDDEKLRDLYSRCTAVLYPPVNEDYGLVPLEAMASYKPIIAVNEGGPKETVEDGKTGFLVDSEQAMADKMAYVAENPQLAAEMGRNGRRRVSERYSWEAFFREFDKHVKKVGKKG